MLVVQKIELTWDKKERTAKSANARKRVRSAYPLAETNAYDNVVVHYQSFWQRGNQFLNTFEPRRKIYCYSTIEKLYLRNIRICENKNEYEVCFCGDASTPYIRGHNKDYLNQNSRYYGKDCLNELAFRLKQNQYGRILWNERCTEFDAGEWYYKLHICNFYVTEKVPQSDIFIANVPDFVYKKMSMLYYHS